METTKRNNYIDILKGICIVLVIFGHCIQYGSGASFRSNSLYFENVVFKLIYSFHMPLFIMISGYLFGYSTTKYSIKLNIIKKLRSLVVPIVAWTTVITTIDLCSYAILEQEIIIADIAKRYVKNVLFEIWFLWAVLFCSITTLLIKRFAHYKPRVLAFLFISYIFLPDMWNMHLYKYLFPYFLIGYIWNIKNGQQNLKIYIRQSKNPRIFVGAIILLIVLYFVLLSFFNTDSFIYTSQISVLGKTVNAGFEQICIDLYRWMIGLIGCILVLVFIRKLSAFHLKAFSLIIYFGKHSMGIYIISGYMNSRILAKLTCNFNMSYVTVILETITMLFITCIIIEVINKHRRLSQLLLGGR